MRIMIVDDSAEMRERIAATIAPLEAEIFECCDGDEALARFGEFQPDWTFMDFQMPNLDGLTALRFLRQRWPTSRVVLLTFSDSPAIRQEALRLGAVECLPKDELHSLVDRLALLAVP